MRPRDQAKEADFAKRQFTDELGDHLTALKAFDAYKAAAGREQDFCWQSYLQPRVRLCMSNSRAIVYDNVASVLFS